MAVRRLIFAYTGATSTPIQPITVQCTPDIFGNGDVIINGLITSDQYRYYNDGTVVTIIAPATNADGHAFAGWAYNEVSTFGAASWTFTVGTTFTFGTNGMIVANYRPVSGTVTGIAGQTQFAVAVMKTGFCAKVTGINLPGVIAVNPSATSNLAKKYAAPGGGYVNPILYEWSDSFSETRSSGPSVRDFPLEVESWVKMTDTVTLDTVTLYSFGYYPDEVTFSFSDVAPDCGVGNGTITAAYNTDELNGPVALRWSNGSVTLTETIPYPVGNFNTVFDFTDELNMGFGSFAFGGFDITLLGVVAMSITGSGVNNTNLINPNGQVTVAITGGLGPYTYLWNTGATTATVYNLPAGTYTVTVIDSRGCEKTTSVTITEPAEDCTTRALKNIKVTAMRAACCASALGIRAQRMRYKGRDCTTENINVKYLIRARKTLLCYIPVGTILRAMTPSSVLFAFLDPDSKISHITLVVGGTTTLVDVGVSDFTVDDMIAYLIANVSGGFTVTGAGDGAFILTAPDETYNGQQAVLTYTGDSVHTYTRTFSGGLAQIVQTAEMNCLSEDQVKQLIENMTSICGCLCSSCYDYYTDIADPTPTPTPMTTICCTDIPRFNTIPGQSSYDMALLFPQFNWNSMVLTLVNFGNAPLTTNQYTLLGTMLIFNFAVTTASEIYLEGHLT